MQNKILGDELENLNEEDMEKIAIAVNNIIVDILNENEGDISSLTKEATERRTKEFLSNPDCLENIQEKELSYKKNGTFNTKNMIIPISPLFGIEMREYSFLGQLKLPKNPEIEKIFESVFSPGESSFRYASLGFQDT